MARFRNIKAQVRALLVVDNWLEQAATLDAYSPLELMNPLLACLPMGDKLTQRAAFLLGVQIDRLARAPGGLEQARNFMRRLMWHMNEESGNIGWGIPEGFSEVLATNRTLAEEFHRVLISYIVDTGKDDNYCDHAPLRRSCYAAVERFARAWPDLSPHLVRRALLIGIMDDPDPQCREAATRALEALPSVDEDFLKDKNAL